MSLQSSYENEVAPSYSVHPKALVESRQIGQGTMIWAFAHIQKNAIIGNDCNICNQVFIENGVQIGSKVTIKNGVSLWSGLKVSNKVFIGPHAIFTNDLWPRSRRGDDRTNNQGEKFYPTILEEGCSIGAGAIIICNTIIGSYSMVAAGSVVSKSVLPHRLVIGNPARMKGIVCYCGQKLLDRHSLKNLPQNTSKLACNKCHKTVDLNKIKFYPEEIL